MDRIYVAIDLKSFYASVECVYRGLDPLDTNLVVADAERTEKTICLAVTPSLKKYGIPGRARLFEVVEKVKEINGSRLRALQGKPFSGNSVIASQLDKDPALELSYITAVPRMAEYMRISSEIYSIYLKYVAPEDIFAYSIDEVFIDATGYLAIYNKTPHDFAAMLIKDVLSATGITATAGIGTNLYLCKIAMDIVAKKIPADKDGVRIAYLDEKLYREKLWQHTPITDFWRVGAGIAKRLEKLGIFTMGDIAEHSLDRWRIDHIYKTLGKNAELLIDQAWGIEPTTLADVKNYRPVTNSLSSGQVLKEPTNYNDTGLIVWEMADMLAFDLAEKGLVTATLTLTVGYDISCVNSSYKGEVTKDHYGRAVPKHAHGTVNLAKHTACASTITHALSELYERIVDKSLYSRRLTIAACNVIREEDIPDCERFEQLSLFSDNTESRLAERDEREQREMELQRAMIKLRQRYGKNAVLKGVNFLEGGTARERNSTIGGHRA